MLEQGAKMELSDDEFDELWQFLDDDSSGTITLDELQRIVDLAKKDIEDKKRAAIAAAKAQFKRDVRQQQAQRVTGVFTQESRLALFDALADTRIQPMRGLPKLPRTLLKLPPVEPPGGPLGSPTLGGSRRRVGRSASAAIWTEHLAKVGATSVRRTRKLGGPGSLGTPLGSASDARLSSPAYHYRVGNRTYTNTISVKSTALGQGLGTSASAPNLPTRLPSIGVGGNTRREYS